jgi:hypothetical protein
VRQQVSEQAGERVALGPVSLSPPAPAVSARRSERAGASEWVTLIDSLPLPSDRVSHLTSSSGRRGEFFIRFHSSCGLTQVMSMAAGWEP